MKVKFRLIVKLYFAFGFLYDGEDNLRTIEVVQLLLPLDVTSKVTTSREISEAQKLPSSIDEAQILASSHSHNHCKCENPHKTNF